MENEETRSHISIYKGEHRIGVANCVVESEEELLTDHGELLVRVARALAQMDRAVVEKPEYHRCSSLKFCLYLVA